MFPLLKQKLALKNAELSNRLVLPPMATEKSAKGMVSQELCDYYERMSRGGYLGLIYTEHSYVSCDGQASPQQLSIADDTCLPDLTRLVKTIHDNGVKVIAQINHAGSSASSSITGLPVVGPSAVLNPSPAAKRHGGPFLPEALSLDAIDRIVEAFLQAAIRAQKAGFDGVEIHSAHGYLLNQFYSPLTNTRQDAYSGASLEGRTRLQTRICREVRSHLGDAFLISLRWGACDYAEHGASLAEVPQAAALFADAGIDLLSISGGMCAYSRPGHSEQGFFAELARAARKAVSIPVLLTGGIKDGEAAEGFLADGSADLIGIGRAILKDPDLPRRLMSEA